ncbi:MAG: hypothetical protein NTW90_03285 [Nitrosospira sp.]|nr:hypothetical protein [Nitrosospira sp.]
MDQHESLDTLAAEFFRVFSRMEYALKAAGYNKGDGNAKANWYEFAIAIEEIVKNPPSPELERAISFIFNAPPKKQIIVSRNLEWEATEPNTKSRAYKLLQYVCRIRNNLFHGGKFNGHWFEPERSEPLLRHSLTILTACVEATPEVNRAYNG